MGLLHHQKGHDQLEPSALGVSAAGANTAFAENGIRLELLCERPPHLEPSADAARN